MLYPAELRGLGFILSQEYCLFQVAVIPANGCSEKEKPAPLSRVNNACARCRDGCGESRSCDGRYSGHYAGAMTCARAPRK